MPLPPADSAMPGKMPNDPPLISQWTDVVVASAATKAPQHTPMYPIPDATAAWTLREALLTASRKRIESQSPPGK